MNRFNDLTSQLAVACLGAGVITTVAVAQGQTFIFIGLMQLFEWIAMWKVIKSQKGRTVDEITYDYMNTGGVVDYKNSQRRIANKMKIYFIIVSVTVFVINVLTEL